MSRPFNRRGLVVALVGAALAASLLAAGGSAARSAAAAPTLVIDNSFTIKTSDPGRAFDPTASIVDRAIYDTLFTYNGGNLAVPVPLLVSTWTESKNAESFTFNLKKNVHFADGTNAAKADTAEQWLNSSASAGAGSGPYTLSAYSTTSQITLVPSTNYWGAPKASFSSVVVRNMVAATQLLNVARGSHEIAIDLSADQAATLKGNSNVSVTLQPSTWIFFLYTNNNPKISTVTSNKSYQQAIRYALNYASLVALAGKGAIQAPGLIPSMFLGALPQSAAVNTSLAKAKAALAASGGGSQSVTLQYPSDLTINGVPFTSLAEKIQSNLQAAGFKITLSGSPTSNWLDVYRSGKMALGLSLWGPDYPDPADYLVFAPGNLVGLRAGWPAGSNVAIEGVANRALVTTNTAARKAIYQHFQRLLNAGGPFFPLIQPTQVFVATKDLKGAVYNAEYDTNITQISPA